MNILSANPVSPLLQTNQPSSDFTQPDLFYQGKTVKEYSPSGTTANTGIHLPKLNTIKSIIGSRQITTEPKETSTQGGEECSQQYGITITDLGETLDKKAVWDDIEYYLKNQVRVSAEHLEKLKQNLEDLKVTEFEYFEDLINHLVSDLNEREGTRYPLLGEISEDAHPVSHHTKGVKLWNLCKYMTIFLAADAGLKHFTPLAGATPVSNNGSSLPQIDEVPTATYRFISGQGFRNVVNKPDGSFTPVLPDACISQAPSNNMQLVNAEPVCIPDGDDTRYFIIGNADSHDRIAISTGHGRGDLSVTVGDGEWPALSAEPDSNQPQNTECVVLENPEHYWTTIAVKGNRKKASLVVDFDEEACRLPVRRGFTNETHVRTNGYPYKSAHLLVYKLNFADAKLDWSDFEYDLVGAREYFKRQSYGNFDVSWEIIEVNLSESIEKYNNGTWLDWENRLDNIVRGTGVNPHRPGRNNLVLQASPTVSDHNSSGGRSSMTVYEKDKSIGVIAHEMGHAMGLRHANVLESGQEIIRTMPDNDSWYKCRGNPVCRSLRKQYLINYGNVYDLMGMDGRGDNPGEMNLLYKSFFGWLDLATDVPLVTTGSRQQTYRIYAFDHGEKSNSPIGLRLKSGNGKYTYWLEYRTTGGYSENGKRGVLMNLEGYAEHENEPEYWRTTSYLLDTTPESKNSAPPNWKGEDYTDSALEIGEIYTDKWHGFRIRPSRVGGDEDTANAWIEVDVVTR